MTNMLGYRQNLSENADYGPSRNVWSGCPWEAIKNGQTDGVLWHDEFVGGPVVAAGAEAAYGLYRGFADTGGTVAIGDELGGSLVLSSDGDNEGASFRQANQAFQISASLKEFWFEARVKKSTITDTKHGLFVGLTGNTALTATSPIAAAGTLADLNLVGFHSLEADGDTFDTVYKADGVTAVTVAADAVTVVADTYVKLGMRFTPRTNKLTFYKNGVPLADTKTVPSATGTDFPADVRLGFTIALLNATGTTPGSSEISWVRIAQLI